MSRRWRSWLLTLAAVTMIPMPALPTLAQDTPEGPQDVLSQLDNAVPGDQGVIVSSRFSATPINDKIAADDFLVPAGSNWWKIDQVAIIGKMCMDEGSGDIVQVVFYNHEGPTDDGKPGSILAISRVTVVQGSNGSCSSVFSPQQYDLVPQSNIWLPPGQKFWLSVHAIAENSSTLNLSRALYWSGRSGLFNQPSFYWTGGSEPSCNKEWVVRTACIGPVGEDMTWALTYTAFRPNFLYVPMLSNKR